MTGLTTAFRAAVEGDDPASLRRALAAARREWERGDHAPFPHALGLRLVDLTEAGIDRPAPAPPAPREAGPSPAFGALTLLLLVVLILALLGQALAGAIVAGLGLVVAGLGALDRLPAALTGRAPPPLPALADGRRRAVEDQLAQADRLLGFAAGEAEALAAGRQAPAGEPVPDALAEALQDLEEAARAGNAAYALALAETVPERLAEAFDLELVPYDPDNAAMFRVEGDADRATTKRPAVVRDGRPVARGYARADR